MTTNAAEALRTLMGVHIDRRQVEILTAELAAMAACAPCAAQGYECEPAEIDGCVTRCPGGCAPCDQAASHP